MKNGLIIKCSIVAFFICFCFVSNSYAQDALSNASERIAESLRTSLPQDIKNLAVWNIDVNPNVSVNPTNIRDSIEIAIVKQHYFNLIDRTKLDLIFQEQGLSQTGLIDPENIKKIGKLYGIDAMIFVEILDNKIDKFTNPTVIIKAIDTETGILASASEIQLEDKYLSTEIDDLVAKAATSILSDKENIRSNGINTIAFWQLEGADPRPKKAIMSKLNSYLVYSREFKIIDRENLAELLKEQTFGATGLVDADTARRLGKLYGVDAFIFGRIKDHSIYSTEDVIDASISVNLKMIDVNTAKIVWADELSGKYSGKIADIYTYFGEKRPPKKPAPSVPGATWIAPTFKSAVLPGWGQFQNGEAEKGVLFMCGYVLTAAGAIVTKQASDAEYQKYLSATSKSDMNTYYKRANDNYQYYQICASTAIALWLLNVIDARLSAPSYGYGLHIMPDKENCKIAWSFKY
jgi:hypothetical protein